MRRSKPRGPEGKVHPSRKHQQGKGENHPQLYNLNNGLAETKKQVKANPEVVRELIKELDSIRRNDHLSIGKE